jgi:hypothetical protein
VVVAAEEAGRLRGASAGLVNWHSVVSEGGEAQVA